METPSNILKFVRQTNDEMDIKHDHLITELESSEGHTASTLRTIYQDGEHEAFLKKLEARILLQDKEIEKMCHRHYQGFIDAVRELLQVRGQANLVKDEISQVDSELQASSRPLISKADELIACRKTQRNACSVVEILELTLPVLEMYAKLQEQMKAKRYYPALKTLEQLEHTYLPRISHFRFTQDMCSAIPTIRAQIKDASMSDLKDFLESIRRHCSRVGEAAMIQTAVRAKMDVDLARKTLAKKQSSNPLNPFASPEANKDEEEPPSPQDLVDFSAVYRCLHINSVLGARDQFESYYRKQRRQQCGLVLDPPANMGESLDGYKSYFHNIIGFFVCEEHILNTTSGLVTRNYMDELWERAVKRIVNQLRTYSAYCTDSSLNLSIKNTIVLFSHCMKGYGFAVTQFYDLLKEVRDQYTEILMQKWVQIFGEIFEADDYTAILVREEEEYYFVISKFPYIDEKLEKAKFPKQFPFSQMVPRVYGQCRQYIYSCLKFCEGLHLSHTEIDDMIRKSTNVLLTRTLSGAVSLLLKQPSLSLLQLIQIAVNMNYLEKSCDFLEEFISNTTGAEKDSVHSSRLRGTAMFKDARNDAEERIYNQINEKVDSFFELAEYEWNCSDSAGTASDYVIDLIAFLRSTFISFSHLPFKLAQTACMSVCKHIADSLKLLLMDEEVTQLSLSSLQQVNLDLVQCEMFASSEPVPGMNDGTLLMAFAELRQLLDLVIYADWNSYIADYGAERNKYARVQPQTLLAILEKMRASNRKANNFLDSFSRLKKPEKDKQQLLDMVIKRIRALQP
ncbi:exocyst complex component 6B-like [Watersipora subatra]|uniref:exocyst complex component 6B-like n=1 Tax=Watersipora subatra TaxID=2589382 RepID=UPI00355B8D55